MPEATKTHTVEARLATADDLPALIANETSRTKGLSAEYLAEQERGDFYVVVGLIDGEIGGRAILDCRDDGETLVPEMRLLWVFPHARRKGLGVAMTAALEDLARDLGYREIFLGVSPENPAAIPLYVELGYAPTGEHRAAVNVSVLDTDAEPPMEAVFQKSLVVR
ncbi:MAG: GNAT family N-acetyltransferase [Propioniciclava sp.]|uniref:GNAT family N-acetyltransferase n=1 Tax=Propioniciclava sp. TaxID=2038686 RepID=UPI0039E3B2C2